MLKPKWGGEDGMNLVTIIICVCALIETRKVLLDTFFIHNYVLRKCLIPMCLRVYS